MSECEKCGSKQNYNFALNIGLCNPCIHIKLEELQSENESLIYLITVMRDYEKDGIPFDDVLKCDIKKALKGDNQ